MQAGDFHLWRDPSSMQGQTDWDPPVVIREGGNAKDWDQGKFFFPVLQLRDREVRGR